MVGNKLFVRRRDGRIEVRLNEAGREVAREAFGRVLIAERAETLRLAAETGTFIYAVADEATPGGA